MMFLKTFVIRLEELVTNFGSIKGLEFDTFKGFNSKILVLASIAFFNSGCNGGILGAVVTFLLPVFREDGYSFNGLKRLTLSIFVNPSPSSFNGVGSCFAARFMFRVNCRLSTKKQRKRRSFKFYVFLNLTV